MRTSLFQNKSAFIRKVRRSTPSSHLLNPGFPGRKRDAMNALVRYQFERKGSRGQFFPDRGRKNQPHKQRDEAAPGSIPYGGGAIKRSQSPRARSSLSFVPLIGPPPYPAVTRNSLALNLEGRGLLIQFGRASIPRRWPGIPAANLGEGADAPVCAVDAARPSDGLPHATETAVGEDARLRDVS